LPDLPNAVYRDILQTFSREFTLVFGGCTIIKGLEGGYLSQHGEIISDRINLIYSDTPFNFQDNLIEISVYADYLRQSADKALDEETILITVLQVYHSG